MQFTVKDAQALVIIKLLINLICDCIFQLWFRAVFQDR